MHDADRRARRDVPVVAVFVTLAVVLGGCAVAARPAAPVPADPTGADVAPAASASVTAPPPGVRWPATGALFTGPPDDLGDHYCTASVVDTPAGDVLITAAHCVAEGDGTPAHTGMAFVPGYHDGVAPFGAWTVTSAIVDQSWLDQATPDDDVAFLTVERPGSPPIAQVTGAYTVDPDSGPAGTPVQIVGYNDDDDGPITVAGTAADWSPTQLRLDAPGLSEGTSGGPWLGGPDFTRIVGVTGGFEEGGLTDETTYAAHLADVVNNLFQQAGGPA